MIKNKGYMPQLEGLRAVAMIGVVYHHWLPKSWWFHFPTEAGLFLFFVMSGFLMTRSLLHERDSKSFFTIIKDFHLKRFRRIYPTYYLALIVAAILGVNEIWQHPQWWLLNLQNFRILQLGEWPKGVSHFWTLAVEQQFYLLWPLIILLIPVRILPIGLLTIASISPAFRYWSEENTWLSMDLVPWNLFDNFAMGSLVAYIINRGIIFPNKVADCIGWISLVTYGFLYTSWEMNHPVLGWACMQQTLLAITCAWLVGRAAVSKMGFLRYFLESKLALKLGVMSYGIYLFHNIAPLLAGKIFWFLWSPKIPDSYRILLQLPFFVALTWIMTSLCTKYVERFFLLKKIKS
jgi:peptidoglycan/LPS O-acetylase OafA/YrhL